MMAYHLDGQKLSKPKLYIGNVDMVQTSSLDETLRTAIKRKYPHQDTVSLAKDIHLYDTQYVKGMIISAGHCSGLPDFYRILSIVVNLDNVSFISRKLSSWFMEHYELVESIYTDVEIMVPEALNDYHPLTAYTVGGKVLVTPKTCLLH